MISSYAVGIFNIRAKYLGGVIHVRTPPPLCPPHTHQDSYINHLDMLELLHGRERDERYQQLRETYVFNRDSSVLRLARGISFNLTTLLPFLYERFAYQVRLPGMSWGGW